MKNTLAKLLIPVVTILSIFGVNSTIIAPAIATNYAAISTTSIDTPAVKSVKLKTTKYTYNGKSRKPAVTIKDTDGNTLTKGTDYTLSYSNTKNPGTASVKIKFIGNYSGTVTETYKIVPKGTKISSIKKAKNAVITVKWKKQTKKTTGYQIQLATNKKFTKNKKTVTVKSNKTTSKKIKGLKGSKKYYVRIRTYKTVDGKKYYSSWSKVKTVKTTKKTSSSSSNKKVKTTSVTTTRTGAICEDGTTSTATGSGACSHHGGVKTWLY